MKKHWSIYPRTKEAQTQGIETDKGWLDFGGKTVVNTTDESLVKSIQEQYPDQAYAVHDEQLSKAKDSGSWDIVKGPKGDWVKSLHNYTFTVTKPKKKTFIEKVKSFVNRRGLTHVFWYWNVNGEKGIRLFGREWTWNE